MSTLSAVILAVPYVAAIFFAVYMIKLTRNNAYTLALIYALVYPILLLAERILADQPCCLSVPWGIIFKIYALLAVLVFVYSVIGISLPYPFIKQSELRQRIQQFYGHGDLDHSVRALRQLVALEPRDLNARCALGKVLNELGKPEKALGQLRFANTLRPGSVEILLELGMSYQMLGKYQEAVNTYKQVLTIETSNETASERIAVCQKQINSDNGLM